MWTKFNRFRKRVDNKFKDVFLSSVEDVASPSLTKTYSQSALNDYFANVVGYATAADLPDASSTIASQLSTLNNNLWSNLFHRVVGPASTQVTIAAQSQTMITLSIQDLSADGYYPCWIDGFNLSGGASGYCAIGSHNWSGPLQYKVTLINIHHSASAQPIILPCVVYININFKYTDL